MGFTKPIEQILLSYQGTFIVSKRYYTRRFISADNLIAEVGSTVQGHNLYVYSFSNPVNLADDSGNWPELIREQNTIMKSSLPPIGDPNSSQTLLNPDGTPKQKRWYGPDGKPIRDRDYNHPGDIEFPHDHEWENGTRGKNHLPPSPEFQFDWEPVVGGGMVVVGIIGIAVVLSDDITGIGIMDDPALIPLSAGVTEGVNMIIR